MRDWSTDPLLALCRAEKGRNVAMYSAGFQTVTELGGDIFPCRSGAEKKENQNGAEN